MQPSSQQGVILPTAMFIVLVILASVSINVVNSRFSLRMSVHYDSKLQAASLAEGGVELGIAELNRVGSTLAQLHTQESSALVVALGPEKVRVWVEPVVGQVSDVELVAQATQGGQVQVRRARLRRTGDPDGVVYSRSQVGQESYTGNDGLSHQRGLFTLYRKLQTQQDWSAIAPPPDRYYQGGPANPVETAGSEGTAKGINSLIGDNQGGLYAVDKREDGNEDPAGSPSEDSLWYHSGSAWSLLVPPPDGAFADATSTTITPDVDFAKRLVQTAFGKDSLFVIAKKKNAIDPIWRRDGQDWKVLPNPALGVTNGGDPSELCVDNTGKVYCTVGDDDDQVIRASTPDGDDNYASWSSLDMPGRPWALAQDAGSEMVVSQDGILYCLRKQRDSANDALFRRVQKAGNWEWESISLPSIDASGQIVASGGSQDGLLTNLAIDSKGRLYLTSPRTSASADDPPDVVYSWDPVQNQWTILPDQKKTTFDAAGQAVIDAALVTTRTLDVAGGGGSTASASGAFRKVFVYCP